MTATANKPKSEKAPKPKKEKPPKPERREFPLEAPASVLNAEGKLTTSDPDSHGYNRKEHKPLKKKDFADEGTFAGWKAVQMRAHGEALIAKSERMAKDAELLRQFGDPKKKAKVKRLGKLADSLAALKAQLAAEGLDVESILNAS